MPIDVGNNNNLRYQLLLWGFLVSLLWVVMALEYILGVEWHFLGVHPRHADGLIGIFTSPFIHGDLGHLASNTLPLFLLGAGIIYFFNDIAGRVLGIVFLMSNILVWLLARPNYHIGASGLIYGYAGFLLMSGLIVRNGRLTGIAMLIIFFYGGMLWGLLPIENGISWEAHASGLASGVLLAFVYRKHIPRKEKYHWEEENTGESNMPSIDEYREVAPPETKEE